MEMIRETPQYRLFKQDNRYYGEEKSHQVYSGDARVHVEAIGIDTKLSVHAGFDAIGGPDLFQRGDYAAIKVNLGGGIH